LRSALALAVATCLVMALRPLWRRWLGAGAVLWLYLLLPAALLATSLPGPTVVVDAPAPVSAQLLTAADGPRSSQPTVLAPPSERFIPATPEVRVGALTAGLLAWAAGAFALAGWLLVQQRRFHR